MAQPPLARKACQQRSHKGRRVPGEPSAGTVSSSVHDGTFPHKDA